MGNYIETVYCPEVGCMCDTTLDCINCPYIEPVYCPELGTVCDTTLDCMNCPYRNQE